MSRLIVRSFSISLDGYGAGPAQSLEQPLGRNGEELHTWMVESETFQTRFGDGGGKPGVDSDMTAKGFDNVGAWILGRNMFGPVRGSWPDDSWKGWWGDTPPYHVPVFVLTHHPRDPIEMEGGTTFHFVTEGIETALERAKQAAGDKDVRLGGGVSTLHQYLKARLIDELHIAVSPVLLGSGESLFHGIDWRELGYECLEQIPGEQATHLIIRRAS